MKQKWKSIAVNFIRNVYYIAFLFYIITTLGNILCNIYIFKKKSVSLFTKHIEDIYIVFLLVTESYAIIGMNIRIYVWHLYWCRKNLRVMSCKKLKTRALLSSKWWRIEPRRMKRRLRRSACHLLVGHI